MKEVKKYISSDLYRYYGEEKISFSKKLKSKLHPARRYMILFRKVQFCKNKFIKKILKYRLRLLSYKTQIQILPDTEIGEGFYIEHFGRIIINKKAIIGKNVNIATGVVIGETYRENKKGCPEIGSEVWIGANSVIVGKIKIGSNVLIAPNSYVNFDVPDNSIVIGNPGIIHHKEDATKSYIKNTV